jgi:hypothetical protein
LPTGYSWDSTSFVGNVDPKITLTSKNSIEFAPGLLKGQYSFSIKATISAGSNYNNKDSSTLTSSVRVYNLFSPNNMTANSSVGCVASAIGEQYPNSTQAFKAFDGSTGPSVNDLKYWCTSGSTNCWLKIQLSSSMVLKRYSFASIGAARSRNWNGTTPKTWTFSGSNDDSNWDQLDSASFTVDGSLNIQWFISTSLANTIAYSYYRINIATVNDASDNLTAISELSLYEE